MRVKKMVIEWDEDGEEDFEIIVVPDWVTALEVMTGEEHDCICSCYSDEGADLIVKLLNRHYLEH